MNHPIDHHANSRLRRNMRASAADGAGFSLMVGLGEAYLAAFALAVGLGEVVAGLIGTVPILAGAILQLVSPRGIAYLGSLRKWVVLCASVQMLSLLPLAITAWLGRVSAPMLMLIATLYWGAALATGPAWNTWIGSIIPRRVRAAFLARRSRICQVMVLTGLVTSGLSLHFASKYAAPLQVLGLVTLEFASSREATLTAFGVLFTAAAAARGFSALMLARQSEARVPLHAQRLVPLREIARRLRGGMDGRLLTYMLTVQVCVQISGPFFTPYMLKRLEFSYAEYLMLTATAFITKTIALPTIARLADRRGAQALLWTSGLAIVPLAGFWMLFDTLPGLFVLQMFAGLIWGTYELATLLLLFDHIDERERTSILTLFNVANAAAMVGGSLLGGAVLGFIVHSRFGQMNDGRFGYHVLFALTTLARVCTLIFLRRAVSVMDRPMRVRLPVALPRVLAVRPQMGSIDRPVVPVNGEDEPETLR